MTGAQKVAAVLDCLGRDLSYGQIARALKAPSRSAVAGVLYRHRHPEIVAARLIELHAEARSERERRDSWSETKLTETWAERKARLT